MSSDPKSLRKQLREQMRKKKLVVSAGVTNPLYARLAERAGFESVYMTGFGTAAYMIGMPDVGLITLSEMVTNLRYICRAVGVPVISDMDNGYGNAINVIRAVNDYEDAGVAGFHVEDQVTPKRCGFMKGKMVIPTEEMVGKIKACVKERRDGNTLMIARTDARAVEGNEAMWERANQYAEAGADVIFAEAPTKLDDLKGDLKHIKSPLLLNGIHPEYGVTSFSEVEKLGYSILILPTYSVRAAARAAYEHYAETIRTGRVPERTSEPKPILTNQELADLVGLQEVRRQEEEFLPKEELLTRYGEYKAPRSF